MNALFSICIPNFNYAKYMDITLSSLKSQTRSNFEVLVADNASTDNSVAITNKYVEEGLPLKYTVNPTNIGFAGNLDKVGEMAGAPWMIMLSSDDIVNPTALEKYTRFIDVAGDENTYAFCSTFEKIDSNGKFIETISPKKSRLWLKTDIDIQLTSQLGFDVYKVASDEMLKRCLNTFLNPFNFASTCYPKQLYTQVGGYGGGRTYNPDKWFHWKLLAATDYVYFLDEPLFQYRWHQQNQAAQQAGTQVLKFWLDEYRNSFEPDEQMLSKAGLTRNELISAYCTHLLKYVYHALKKGKLAEAKRLWSWGYACYPKAFSINTYNYLLRVPLFVIRLWPL